MFDRFIHKFVETFISKSGTSPEPDARLSLSSSSKISPSPQLSPELSSHRAHSPSNSPRPVVSPTFSDAAEMAPQTTGEFIEIIKKTPKSVLSAKDRRRIAAVMSFDAKKVRDLMVPRSKMIFVRETELLGPLTLDKLYKSGFNIFPVVNSRDHVLGVIHTESLNALEIRDTKRAADFIDPEVQYLHNSDSLKTAISEIEHTGSLYFLVLDELDTLTGCFTIKQLLDYLLG